MMFLLAAESSTERRSWFTLLPRRAGARDGHTGFVTMNFAASASKPQDGSGTPLKAVQIDGQVRAAMRPDRILSAREGPTDPKTRLVQTFDRANAGVDEPPLERRVSP
jgi:hypothetical protein